MIDDIEFTTRTGPASSSRYIEVYDPDGLFVSRHTNFEECTESAFQYAKARDLGGEYEFRTPNKIMAVEIVQYIPGTQIDPPKVEDIASLAPGIASAVGFVGSVIQPSGQLTVYPNEDPAQLDSASIFFPDRAVITNVSATFEVRTQVLLGGTLNVYDYGYFDYENTTSATGAASFQYVVFNYDNLNNDTTGTWTITVQ